MAAEYSSLKKQSLGKTEVGEGEFDVYQVDEVDLVLERDFYIVGNTQVTGSGTAFDIFKQFWNANLLNIQEQMSVMLLNQSNKVIGMYQHSKGAINATVADRQLILAVAIKSLAKGIIIAHNHPSGNLKPSDSDITLTKQLDQGLGLFGIKLLDSLIVSGDGESYKSLYEEGLFEDGGEVYDNYDDIDDFDRGGEVREFNVMYFNKIATRDGSKIDVMRDRDVISGSLEKVVSKALDGFNPIDDFANISDRKNGAIVARLMPNGKGEVFEDGYGLEVGKIEVEQEVEKVEDKPKKKLFGLFAKGGAIKSPKPIMVEKAYKLGQKAFLEGKKSIPYHDAALNELIKSETDGSAKQYINYADSWAKGWLSENFKNPVSDDIDNKMAEGGELKKDKRVFRIIRADGRIKYAGTDSPSWLTLDEARKLVDRSKGETIYEYSQDYMRQLWEIFEDGGELTYDEKMNFNIAYNYAIDRGVDYNGTFKEFKDSFSKKTPKSAKFSPKIMKATFEALKGNFDKMAEGSKMAKGGKITGFGSEIEKSIKLRSKINAAKSNLNKAKKYKQDIQKSGDSVLIDYADKKILEAQKEYDLALELWKNEYGSDFQMAKGGITGDVHSLTDKLLSQKIQIFIDKVQPIKYYYIDDKTNSLIVGLDENYTQDAADKLYKAAISSMEFFDADSVDMKYISETGDTQYIIKLKKPVKFGMGGKVTFEDKVKAIKSSLLKRKKVSPKVQKDYGKTYSPKEAEESAKRIVGAMTAKERLLAKMKKRKK